MCVSARVRACGRGTQTFAALCSVVGIPTRAIATGHGSHRVDTFAFAVAAAIAFQALVYFTDHVLARLLTCELIVAAAVVACALKQG